MPETKYIFYVYKGKLIYGFPERRGKYLQIENSIKTYLSFFKQTNDPWEPIKMKYHKEDRYKKSKKIWYYVNLFGKKIRLTKVKDEWLLDKSKISNIKKIKKIGKLTLREANEKLKVD